MAYTFGWGTREWALLSNPLPPGASAKALLHMRLHTPRALSRALITLLGSENLRPEYNERRGGANVDAAFVGLKGQVVRIPSACALELRG